MKKIILLFLVFSHLGAAEIDSFTNREEVLDLKDSLDDINDFFNQRLEQAVIQVNKDLIEDLSDRHGEIEFCDEDELHERLISSIFNGGGSLKGYALDLAMRDEFFDQSIRLPLDQSMYQNISWREGFSLNLKELSHVVNINDYVIGLDKFGHFFAEGLDYYKKAYTTSARNNGARPKFSRALDWGAGKEEGLFGLITTGVFSYADLVANFNGMRFWNQVLGKGIDPLNPDDDVDPMFSCSVNYVSSFTNMVKQLWNKNKEDIKWVYQWDLNGKIDFDDYIDGTWDEAYNCSKYDDEDYRDIVLGNIEKSTGKVAQCPIIEEENKDPCSEAKEVYGTYARHILHPSCFEKQLNI